MATSVTKVEFQLPLLPEYLSVLRATTSVIAGISSFRYDEIIQLRAAVSEVFDLEMDHAGRRGLGTEDSQLAIRFTADPRWLEIFIAGAIDDNIVFDSEEGQVRKALLQSLVDEVSVEVMGLRLIKYRSASPA